MPNPDLSRPARINLRQGARPAEYQMPDAKAVAANPKQAFVTARRITNALRSWRSVAEQNYARAQQIARFFEDPHYQNGQSIACIPFIRFLCTNRTEISQRVWLAMDRYRVYRMVHGRTLHGEPVASLIDPQPVGIFGNYVAFRWG